jgi:hypothetical protein
MRKRVLLLLALAMLLTVVYAFFAAWTSQAYNRWANDAIQREAHGHPELIGYIDVTPCLDTVYGQTAIAAGVIVVVFDIIVLVLLWSRRNLQYPMKKVKPR